MAKKPRAYRPPHAPSRREQNRVYDQRRGSASARGYDNRWAKASATHRRRHPLCEYCALEGVITPCAVTDHLYPAQDYSELFWVTRYWVSSCTPCHSGFKQSIERQGKPALDALAQRLGRDPWKGGGGGSAPTPTFS